MSSRVLLYHNLVKPGTGFFPSLLLCGLAALAWHAPEAGASADRLDRFRQLAASRLALIEREGLDPPGDHLREIYALLDGELIENLNSGPLFASEEFLEERLEGFSAVWGGSAFRVLKLPGGTLWVGSFQLTPGGHGNSVRTYVRSSGRFELGRAMYGSGTPTLFKLPPTRSGAGQLYLAWVGSPSGRGSSALRVELLRQDGEALSLAWSTAHLFAGDLLTTGFRVDGERVTIRYELQYPGWKPGCEGQTEQEDLYQYRAASGRVVLVRRRTINGWHRALHSGAVSPLFQALAAGNRAALAQLVPDPAVRSRLPGRLLPDLACDASEGPDSSEAVVSALAPDERRVWDLRFRQRDGGWRLVGASPLE